MIGSRKMSDRKSHIREIADRNTNEGRLYIVEKMNAL